MSRNTAILVLLLAATLEAGGDAIIRVGTCKYHLASIRAVSSSSSHSFRLWLDRQCTALGLWKAARALCGVFFIIAQLISWIFFKQAPSLMVDCDLIRQILRKMNGTDSATARLRPGGLGTPSSLS
jgi:hypothetical protein